jgi:hypothetical protein
VIPPERREPWDRTRTVPLPAVGFSRPAVHVPRGLRLLEATAGLLSAGLLVLGVALAVLRFAAPTFVHDPGLSTADGPATGRIVVQLAVGALGELLRLTRTRLPIPSRAVAAVAVIIGVFAALWWSWWR